VDCAKTFDADQAGFNVDLDFSHGETLRGAQLTPPGSACSIAPEHRKTRRSLRGSQHWTSARLS
jgi:hypothetical protein